MDRNDIADSSKDLDTEEEPIDNEELIGAVSGAHTTRGFVQAMPMAAGPTGPVVPSVPTPTPTPTGCYVISSKVDDSVFPAGSVVRKITPNTKASKGLDLLVSMFPSGRLAMTSIPSTTYQSFSSEDDLSNWFAACLGLSSETQPTLLMAKGSTTDIITDLFLTIKTPFKLTSNVPWSITYTTEAPTVKRAFAVSDSSPTPTPLFPYGNLDLAATMVLGLDNITIGGKAIDPNNQPQTTLANVIKFIGMKSGAIMRGLTSTLSLTLDTSDAKRNALWTSSNGYFRTTLRLPFKITELDKFSSFVHDHVTPNMRIDPNKTTVIARRVVKQGANASGYYRSDAPQLAFEVVLLRDTVDLNGAPITSELDAVFSFEPGGLEIIIQPDHGGLADMLGWLASLVPGLSTEQATVLENKARSVENWIKQVSSLDPRIRRLMVVVDSNGLSNLQLDCELDVNFGKSDTEPSANVGFLVSPT